MRLSVVVFKFQQKNLSHKEDHSGESQMMLFIL